MNVDHEAAVNVDHSNSNNLSDIEMQNNYKENEYNNNDNDNASQEREDSSNDFDNEEGEFSSNDGDFWPNNQKLKKYARRRSIHNYKFMQSDQIRCLCKERCEIWVVPHHFTLRFKQI